jgi:magnesium transporter
MASKRSDKAGLPPGALVSVAEGEQSATIIRTFAYDPANYTESSGHGAAEVLTCPADTVTWIDIDGLADVATIKALSEHFGLHSLITEDILNTDQRPKLEEHQDHLFVVAKMLSFPAGSTTMDIEQVSFVLGANYLISFQQRPGDILDPVRERIRHNTGSVRRKSADFLLYSLLDVIVDNYFAVVDTLGDRIGTLQRKVIERPDIKDLKALLDLRGSLITVGRHVLPMRELAGRLNTLQNPLVDKNTRRYLNDLQDHTVYIAESIAMFRDMVSNLENTYHAQINARMAQVMRLLTVISTIFIPLTFIVGVYGMNFRHMPELEWRHGYFAVMALMAVIAGGMLLWFRRKGWI